MTFSDMGMKELSRSTSNDTHNITSLICTPQVCLKTSCRWKKPSQWESIKKNSMIFSKELFMLPTTALKIMLGRVPDV